MGTVCTATLPMCSLYRRSGRLGAREPATADDCGRCGAEQDQHRRCRHVGAARSGRRRTARRRGTRRRRAGRARRGTGRPARGRRGRARRRRGTAARRSGRSRPAGGGVVVSSR
ncbi:hypothetical protein TQ38_015735 [Novosphingobium sp. P6W]|nr:hypothetical protein TQ38_015735 [Novosphingobium sp. P6W]